MADSIAGMNYPLDDPLIDRFSPNVGEMIGEHMVVVIETRYEKTEDRSNNKTMHSGGPIDDTTGGKKVSFVSSGKDCGKNEKFGPFCCRLLNEYQLQLMRLCITIRNLCMNTIYIHRMLFHE